MPTLSTPCVSVGLKRRPGQYFWPTQVKQNVSLIWLPRRESVNLYEEMHEGLGQAGYWVQSCDLGSVFTSVCNFFNATTSCPMSSISKNRVPHRYSTDILTATSVSHSRGTPAHSTGYLSWDRLGQTFPVKKSSELCRRLPRAREVLGTS